MASAGPLWPATASISRLGLVRRRAGQRGQAVVGVDPASAAVSNSSAEHRVDGVAEDDRVGDLHHRRLQVDREQDAATRARRRAARPGRPSSASRRITAASITSPASSGVDSFSTVTVSVRGHVLDPHVVVRLRP